MYQYNMCISLLLILLLTVTSTSSAGDEKVQVKNRSPLMLSFDSYFRLYVFPKQVSLTRHRKEKYFRYYGENDEHYFCPKENEASENHEDEEHAETIITHAEEFTNENCLVEKKFEVKDNEEKLCESEVKPVIVEEKNRSKNKIPCGGTGYMYKFAYKLCREMITEYMMGKNKGFSQEFYSTSDPTYEVCYDHSQNRVLFTKHSILTPDIFRNANYEKERARHKFPQKYSTEGYGIENFKIFEKMADAYEKQANYEDKQVLQMLVPTEDFALGHWMKTTFHIINYALLHESKVPVWDAINTHVRTRIINKKSLERADLTIFSGIFDGQSADENKDKLDPENDQNSGIIIPKLWWKLIHFRIRKEGVVIIMHNDNDSKKICDPKVKACNVSKWKTGKLKKADFQFVYCCSFSSASEHIPILSHLGIESYELENGDLKVLQLD